MEKPENNTGDQREQALLSWIQEFAPYGVFTLDTQLRLQSWNRWMELHSSLPSADVIGRNIFEVFPELEARKLITPFQRALEGESSVLSTALHRYLLSLRSPLNGRAGEVMRQTARINPLHWGASVCGVIVVIEDVTQRENQAEILVRQHRHDEALSWALVHLLKSDEPRKTVRQLFFKIAEHLDFDTFFLYLRDVTSGAVRLYTAGGITDDAQKQFLEYELFTKAADAPGTEILNKIKCQEDSRYTLLQEAKISAAIVIPLSSREQSLGALCFGSWSRDHISAEESGLLATIAQYLATAVDKENTNSELRRVEAANQWMGAIVESSDDSIISTDLGGIIKSCNPGAARLFGYASPELIGKSINLLIPGDHQQEEAQIFARIRSGKQVERFETIRRRKDGGLIDVSVTVSPVFDNAGNVIGASRIARDITERRQSEQRLLESFRREKLAREKSEAANSAKDDFLASLSHELRTPLSPILLIASDAAERASLSPEVKADFEAIRKNIELEARMIDDLLDVTRITHGKLSLQMRVVDLKEILEDTIKNVQAEVAAKDIDLQFDFLSPRKLVYGDDVRLQQVFWNVLRNAVKFTPARGKITVAAKDVENRLQISVTDTGIGIAPGATGKIFEAFSQGHSSHSAAHRFGGLGLGLAIARKLVEMHDGRIGATSEGEGKGSTFTIKLPPAEREKPPVPPLVTPPDPGTRELSDPAICILLVEDHEPTRMALLHLLSRRGYKIIPASNASDARNASTTEKIDLVISDIGLPDESGNDLMMHFSTTFGLKGIALTGYGMEADIEKSRASGFVTHLVKPVSIRALENALSRILHN